MTGASEALVANVANPGLGLVTFPVALANGSVDTIVLAEDISLADSLGDWPQQLPLLLTRNVTVTSGCARAAPAPSGPEDWRILNSAYLGPHVMLMNATFTMRNLILVRVGGAARPRACARGAPQRAGGAGRRPTLLRAHAAMLSRVSGFASAWEGSGRGAPHVRGLGCARAAPRPQHLAGSRLALWAHAGARAAGQAQGFNQGCG